MKRTLVVYALLAVFITSCGNAKKDQAGDLNDKKAQLEKLKQQQKDINDKITALQAEINQLDTTTKVESKKLVSLTVIEPDTFSHFIEIEGKVDAQNISYVAPPNGVGGIVKALYVTQGQSVQKGQLLAKLDDQLLLQQIDGIKVQLNTAEDTYKRTQSLWNQGIGTYQSVLNAKTQVESLQKSIESVQRQIGLTRVVAPSSGVADRVNVRVGEMFTAQAITIVNTNDLKITANVPETYLGKVNEGSKLNVVLPDENNRTIQATVSVVGKLIDPNTRTFYVEARIPSSANLKPNQLAKVHINDYFRPNAIAVPVSTVQNDETGKFVMVAVTENGKLVARKRNVNIGQLYGDRLEIKSGLRPGDKLITDGFQGLYDGQLITTQAV